jgi:hypothetical protein
MQIPVMRVASEFAGAPHVRRLAALLLVLSALGAPACSKKRSTHGVDGAPHLADDAAGKPCKRDSQCGGGRCVSALHIVATDTALTAPDGYCTLRCEDDSECGAHGLCSVPAGETHGECLARCSADQPCREGYDCVGNSASFGLPGTCQPLPATDKLEDGVVGIACESNGDCGGGLCFGKTPVGASLPDNYCTGRCLSDEDCGAGGGCLTFSGSGRAGTCFLRCKADADCERPGYRCRPVSPEVDGCYPAPDALADHHAGKACEQSEDCGGGEAWCAQALPFFGGADEADAPNGYCTQSCSLDRDCGEGAQCISRGAQGALCFARCVDASDCREGYACVAHGRSNDDSERVCVPDV